MAIGNKRRTSGLIPYKVKNGVVEIYLQKRSETAKRMPGNFGCFGGHAIENETPENTLEREIKEELNFLPRGYSLLGRYEFEDLIGHYYLLRVDDSFEGSIKVLEGEYGKFFTENDVMNEQKIHSEDKKILHDAFSKIKSETARKI